MQERSLALSRSLNNRGPIGRTLAGMVAGSVVVVATLLGGCVQPSESEPWSTKSASITQPKIASASSTERVDPEEPSEATEPRSTPVAATPVAATQVASSEQAAPPSPTPAPVLRGSTPWDRAGRVVEIAAQSENALERAYAFEAMQEAPELLLEYGGRGVVDENRGVRFVATMAIGRAMVAPASGPAR